MKKKAIGILILVVVIAIAIVVITHSKSLISLIEKGDIEGSAHAVYIEQMSRDSDLEVRALTDKNKYYDELESCIKDTKVRYIKNQAGIECDQEIYTLTFRGDNEESGTINVSINDSGQIHFNNTDATYEIVGDSDIFELSKKAFEETFK